MEQLKAMYPVCTLIKSDGTRCGSPALTGMNFCFHHIGGNVPKPKPESRRINTPLNFIYPSCHEAIQHNLFLVVQALSEGEIDNATAITYDRLLRSAQLNLHRWQAAKSKLNQDETEQQMMPCAPNPDGEPEPEPAPSPASNGVILSEPGPPASGLCSMGWKPGAPDTRGVRVTGLGSEEPAFCESATDPFAPSAPSVVKNEDETMGELTIPATRPVSLHGSKQSATMNDLKDFHFLVADKCPHTGG